MFGIPTPLDAALAPYKLWLYLGAIIAVAAGGGYLTYRWMEADNLKFKNEKEQADANATNAAKYAKRLDENLVAEQQLSSARAGRLINSENANVALRVALANARTSTPWLSLSIPTSVRELRRTDAGCPPNLFMPCPPIAAPTHAGTTANGFDRGRTNYGSWLTKTSTQIVQRRQGESIRVGKEERIRSNEVAKLEVVQPGVKLPMLPKEPYE